jgi:sigma-B regulation protein RsbU (phosphoserine phosphatase)
MARDLQIAKNIQRSLLLKTLPQLPGFGLAGYCESARQVGGDFYDVVKLSDDALLLIIADVMGKGIPAAMFAAILRSLLRALPELTRQPSELLSRVNRLLFDELSEVDMFITAQLVYVDARKRRLVTASAGHCPLLLAVAGDGAVKPLSPEGMPLGILPDTFTDETAELPANCRVLLYTDGLTEARNAQGELFGQERLMEWLKRATTRPHKAEDLKNELVSELLKFQANTSLKDDQTFLIMAQ